ncbi:DnaJ-domain-containing protein [Rhizoclosmatium globosum]|uniref:DnaJ-domain-containing protein n=1 Tax=Rhizoclosmatium globosum TaxID=329046 RepID=A0A1Y2CI72_9FUNG|nr:DnaJ-domain-containing protein [Rhizoclosmatium globosum]|eukprot:ORY46005.1 DnaJ-domain-containing protein [Rhizoclosmatium globosum]
MLPRSLFSTATRRPLLTPTFAFTRGPLAFTLSNVSLRFASSAPARKQSFYEVLGVPATSTRQEMKSKFYELSMKHHPDKNPNNQEAAKVFVEINEAYSVLSDEGKRREYDRELSVKSNTDSGVNRSGYKTTMRRHSGVNKKTLHPDDWILHRDPNKSRTHQFYDYGAHQNAHYPMGSEPSSSSSGGPGRTASNLKARKLFYDYMREENRRQPNIVMAWLVVGCTMFYLLNAGYVQMIFI